MKIRQGSTVEQLRIFGKTMLGKAIIPTTFIPLVLFTQSNLLTVASAAAWSSLLLATTAGIQAIAHEKSPLKEVAKLVSFGGAAVTVGTIIGRFVPTLLEQITDKN